MNTMRPSNVMRVMTLTGVLVISALLSACGSRRLSLNVTRGSGNVKTESRQVSGFTNVQLDTSGDLTFSQSESESLTIEAEDNLLPFLTSDVSSGTLKLSTKPNTGFSATKPIKYTLVVKNLTTLKLNGSGNITAGDLTTVDKFAVEGNGSGSITLAAVVTGDTTIDLSGSGSLNVASLASANVAVSINGFGDAQIATLDAQSLSANLKGNGSLGISGSVTDQNVTISGSGDFNGDKLASKTAVIKTDGSGSATVQVSDKLDATISGSGDITYMGNPTVTQKDDGSGKITRKS